MASQVFGALVIALCGLCHLSNGLSVRIEPAQRELLVAEGSREQLKCIVEQHMSKDDVIEWTPGNSDEEQRSEKMNSDGTYTTTLTLTIPSFSAARETYECSVKPVGGGTEGQSAILLVMVKEDKPEPVFYFGNETIELYCTTGLTEAKLKGWFKGDEQIEDGEKYKLNSTGALKIMKLDRDDAGLYTARYDLTNQVNKTYDCIVEYKAGPLVLDMDKSINKVEGDSVDIKCEVKGWPHPEITWLKGKEVLKEKSGSIKFSPNSEVANATLTLSDLEYDDAGTYTCRAYTKEFNETNEKSIKLRVKDKLEWLWPFLGIIAEAVVLVLLILFFEKIKKKGDRWRGRVVSASDSRSGGRGFDSQPCHVAVVLGKQLILNFPSPSTCKMGTQLQAILEFVICACNILHMGQKLPSKLY
ncbi:neuroplastin [Elysia marginata]|uniref:Neuroplastin n=1 Tax=Elysia marginata TaxID=1093978 RepID=A0AAV4HMS3_9GAST|nr:neuroplastin [Elysia marginata]